MAHGRLKRKQSKRLSCRTKYKVEKKVREHNRKKRRELRKNPKGSRPDLIVAPNLCPFKEQLIEEMNREKKREEELKMANIQASNPNANTNQDEATSLQAMLYDAQYRAEHFQPVDPRVQEDLKMENAEKMESATLAKEFRKVVAAADVILEVVDARDPLGTRCKIVEEAVLKAAGGKRLVIVVNKADLVPRDILEKWLTYLRASWPAVPFKASVQQQSKKLGRRAMTKKSKKNKKFEKLMSVSCCVGAEFLMKVLANYRRNKGITTSITVGVVGMPNVGKSSIINSLKRTKSCRVGAEPGITRTLQTVQIGAFIKILDSPGIVTEIPLVENQSLLCLKNLVRTDQLLDATLAARIILSRATKTQMMNLYDVPDYGDTDEFLRLLAKRFGILGKRGIPDVNRAARTLVYDWNRGKIRYYTEPPSDNEAEIHVSAEIVTEMAKEFDVEEFQSEERMMLDLIGESKDEKKLAYLAIKKDDDMDVDDDKLKDVVIDTSVKAKKTGKLRWRKKKKEAYEDNGKEGKSVPGVSRAKKLQKLAAKKKRKTEARQKKSALTSSTNLD